MPLEDGPVSCNEDWGERDIPKSNFRPVLNCPRKKLSSKSPLTLLFEVCVQSWFNEERASTTILDIRVPLFLYLNSRDNEHHHRPKSKDGTLTYVIVRHLLASFIVFSSEGDLFWKHEIGLLNVLIVRGDICQILLVEMSPMRVFLKVNFMLFSVLSEL